MNPAALSILAMAQFSRSARRFNLVATSAAQTDVAAACSIDLDSAGGNPASSRASVDHGIVDVAIDSIVT